MTTRKWLTASSSAENRGSGDLEAVVGGSWDGIWGTLVDVKVFLHYSLAFDHELRLIFSR